MSCFHLDDGTCLDYCDNLPETERWSIRPASHSERVKVLEFVTQVHLEATGYSEAAYAQQVQELPDDFPELHIDTLWLLSKSWLCFTRPEEGHQPVLVGCIGLRHASDRTAEIGYFYVHKDYRGICIGRTLLGISLKWLKISSERNQFPYNYNRVVLITLFDILKVAVAVYQNEGFFMFKEEKTKYFVGWHMSLDLTSYAVRSAFSEMQHDRTQHEDMIRSQISEIEIMKAAYEAEFSMIENSKEYLFVLEGMCGDLDNNLLDRPELSFSIVLRGNNTISIRLPCLYPTCPLKFSLITNELTLSLQNQLKAGINRVIEENIGNCCCLAVVQEAKELFQHLCSQLQTQQHCTVGSEVTFTGESDKLAQFLIYFHHIKSSAKKCEIVETAKLLSLGGLWKVDFPGIVIVEGALDNVLEFVKRIQRLHWQHMVVRGERIEKNEVGMERRPTRTLALEAAVSKPASAETLVRAENRTNPLEVTPGPISVLITGHKLRISAKSSGADRHAAHTSLFHSAWEDTDQCGAHPSHIPCRTHPSHSTHNILSLDDRRRLPSALELVGSMSELGQRCRDAGLHDLFMTCMKS